MRQAEKERKEFQTPIPLILDAGEKIQEKKCKKIQKIKKQLPGVSFSENGIRQDETGQEREKRILDPNSAHTRPGGENSEKNSKKIQKFKKTTFRRYFQPNWDETGREREKTILDPNSAHTRPGGENSEKKYQKNSKN